MTVLSACAIPMPYRAHYAFGLLRQPEVCQGTENILTDEDGKATPCDTARAFCTSLE